MRAEIVNIVQRACFRHPIIEPSMVFGHSANPTSSSSAPEPAFPAVTSAVRFVQGQWVRLALVSGLLAVPCLWRKHIQASDLASHLYNAWLVQLIRAGQAPGLHTVLQYTNVLFDHMLSALMPLGPGTAEKLAVWIAVLVYFWGAFALCSAAAGTGGWVVAPLLAMCAYGYIFHMGFFNMYLSAGLGLWSLALVWRGRRWDFVFLAPLLVLMFLAHVFGVVAFIALALFVGISRLLRPRWQFLMLGGSLVLYLGLLAFVYSHAKVDFKRDADIYWMWGPDQLVVFTRQYSWLAVLVLLAVLVPIMLFLIRQRLTGMRQLSLWLCLWAITGFVGYTMPGTIDHPLLQNAGFLTDRISLYSFVFLCCLVAMIKPARLQPVVYSALAVGFFALLYGSTAPLDRIETEIQKAVLKLPPNSRVVATIFPVQGSRIYIQHALDRACIGHCFSIGNYEPSTRQFRVRADEGNRIVATNNIFARQMQQGYYYVTPRDLPLTEFHLCGPGFRQICTHELSAGELTGLAAFAEFQARIGPVR